MKIVSWNVNGIRAVMKHGFLDFLKKENPDLLCLQETKPPAGGAKITVDGYEVYWNNGPRPAYSGTSVFSRKKPLSVTYGMGIGKHDQEGRVMTVEYGGYYVVNVYVPNSKRDLSRLDYRVREWDVDFLKYLKQIEKKKPVIFCGDLNVAHREIDLANPKSNEKNHGFTPQERAGFDALVTAGFIDTYREFVKDPGHYTWWSRLNDCRKRNIGWRIDYICVSGILRKKLKNAWILDRVPGSDHCPVGLEIID